MSDSEIIDSLSSSSLYIRWLCWLKSTMLCSLNCWFAICWCRMSSVFFRQLTHCKVKSVPLLPCTGQPWMYKSVHCSSSCLFSGKVCRYISVKWKNMFYFEIEIVRIYVKIYKHSLSKKAHFLLSMMWSVKTYRSVDIKWPVSSPEIAVIML